MSVRPQESVMIDIWTVPSGHQQEMAEALRDAFEDFRSIEGFCEGGVLANQDGTKVAAYLRMRSPAELQRAVEQDDARERTRELREIGSSHADTYERLWVIAPPMEHGPVQVSHGAF
jgi:heme-degrading monooxygenase HmoA